jgi:ribosomal protein S18 acetylase RimI-like enzyme
MQQLSLRKAAPADVSVLLDMMEDFNSIEEIGWSRGPGGEALSTLLGDESLGVVGLFDEGSTACGYFVLTWGYDLEWSGRDAFLTELYLLPPYRGRGHARGLLARVETLAREHGSRAVHLIVRPENAPARRLYEGSGYVSPPRIFLTKELD